MFDIFKRKQVSKEESAANVGTMVTEQGIANMFLAALLSNQAYSLISGDVGYIIWGQNSLRVIDHNQGLPLAVVNGRIYQFKFQVSGLYHTIMGNHFASWSKASNDRFTTARECQDSLNGISTQAVPAERC